MNKKKAKALAKLDKYLDKAIHDEETGWDRWTWNADHVLALAIASAARSTRKGPHRFTETEQVELKKLEKYFTHYALANDDEFFSITRWQADWCRAEAMHLFTQYFGRLWS